MKLIPKAGFALVAAAFALAAQAQELTGTLKKIKDTGAITIGHRESSIPFSYLDDKQQPVGYAMDLCMKVVDAVKAELKMPNLKVNLQPVTSGNRIPCCRTAPSTWSAARRPTAWSARSRWRSAPPTS